MAGLIQPVIDGLKLLIKERFSPFKNFYWGFILGPFVGFLVIIFLWLIFEPEIKNHTTFFSFVFIFTFIGIGVYSTLVSGWRRTSKFASIGAVRSCSQSVSYEISLVFLIFRFLLFFSSFIITQQFHFFLLLLFFPVWLRCVAETNRAPFDFREGERELISGFNLEFGSAGFVFLFLAEYGIIIFFCYFLNLIFFSGNFVIFSFLLFVFIFIRRVFPRFRYDLLIKITWTKFLPLSLFFLFLIFCLFYYL